MTIVVLVKQVPDMNAVRIDKTSGAASTSGKAMSSFDAYALQHALHLRDQVGGEIVVVSAGPATAKDALTRALAMGADRGIHVLLDDEFVRDSLDLARALADAIAPIEPDVVLCGQQSDDIETGQIGPQLAELLAAPHVSNVMTVAADGDALRMQRDTEGGYQQVRSPLPVVVMVTSSAEEPPYPSIKGMMAAKRKPVERIAAAEPTADPRLTWSEPKAPMREIEGIIVQGETAQEAAKKLVSWLQENKLIAS